MPFRYLDALSVPCFSAQTLTRFLHPLCRGLVGFLGFQHDRRLALRALALSASKSDVHSVFSGLVLMTYHGVVLLMSGWQADVDRIVREYERVVARYVPYSV